MIQKFNQYNENIRDKMTPVSEEDLRSNLGERYTEYKNLLDIKETLSKRPFSYGELRKFDDPMFLIIQTELNNFTIKYNGGKFHLSTMSEKYEFNTKNDLISKMKSITLDSLKSYEKYHKEEISKLYKEIEDMKEEISYINKNY